MTTIRPNRNGPLTALRGHGVEVRWSGLTAGARGGARCVFVIALHPVDEHHALLDAWLETAEGSQSVTTRRPVSWEIAGDGDRVHVDATLDGQRVVALSLDTGGKVGLLYAQSPLLARAGLAPGGYDPPEARLVALRRDMASA